MLYSYFSKHQIYVFNFICQVGLGLDPLNQSVAIIKTSLILLCTYDTRNQCTCNIAEILGTQNDKR